MTALPPEWRVVDGVASAWFEAPSLIEGAALAARVVEQVPETAIDLRTTGVRVRLDGADQAPPVSAAAGEFGLKADPAVLQVLGVVIESADPTAVRPFWERVLDYAPTDAGGLSDPLRRDPAVVFVPSAELRPLRNRIHLDVVRPAGAVAALDFADGAGPYGVCHSDPDGNEVDLVPGDPLGDSEATSDWQAVFGAVACYRTASPTQQRDLILATAAIAEEAGFPLMVDVRPGLVILDSGKDLWDADAHGLDLDFTDLAAKVQSIARELGATADPALARFMQLFLDAADVDGVRAFWMQALGYVDDRRDGVTDIVDPRRLNPVMVFQPLDPSDAERRRQRNRIHFELAVPADAAPTRVAAILAAGGHMLEESSSRWRIADPEHNELVIVAGA